MTLPPMFVLIRIGKNGRRGFPLWLPILLAWPFIAAMGALAALLVVLVMLVKGSGARRIALIAIATWRVALVVCALRGLRVRVRDNDRPIDIGVW